MGTGLKRHLPAVEIDEQMARAFNKMHESIRKISGTTETPVSLTDNAHESDYWYARGVQQALLWVRYTKAEDKPFRD